MRERKEVTRIITVHTLNSGLKNEIISHIQSDITLPYKLKLF